MGWRPTPDRPTAPRGAGSEPELRRRHRLGVSDLLCRYCAAQGRQQQCRTNNPNPRFRRSTARFNEQPSTPVSVAIIRALLRHLRYRRTRKRPLTCGNAASGVVFVGSRWPKFRRDSAGESLHALFEPTAPTREPVSAALENSRGQEHWRNGASSTYASMQHRLRRGCHLVLAFAPFCPTGGEDALNVEERICCLS